MDVKRMINKLIRRGITEKEIAEYIGATQSGVNKIKSGVSKNPSYKNVLGIEGLYRVACLERNYRNADH